MYLFSVVFSYLFKCPTKVLLSLFNLSISHNKDINSVMLLQIISQSIVSPLFFLHEEIFDISCSLIDYYFPFECFSFVSKQYSFL